MLKYAQLFVDYLDIKGIKYTVVDERTVKVVYNGDNLDSIPVFVFFDIYPRVELLDYISFNFNFHF